MNVLLFTLTVLTVTVTIFLIVFGIAILADWYSGEDDDDDELEALAYLVNGKNNP